MSLINDALKRAKEAQKKDAPFVAAPTTVRPTPMRPMKVRRQRRDWGWILPVAIALLILTAFFFIGLAMAKRTVKTIVATPEISTTQQVETVAAAPVPNAPPPEVIVPAAAINTANTEPPAPPRIQGIAYDPVHPWAIVSGKTVYVGDLVNGMRVMAISRHSITLAGNGQTNRFIVGQQ
jgi:hypothetical protein